MRPLSSSAGWFLICCLAAIASRVAGQEIRFTGSVHDFGQLKSGGSVKCDFVFTNTGDAVLVVSNVQASCGCTTAGRWTPQVEPGKTGNIPIQLDSSRVGGPIHVTIKVTSNDKNQPLRELKLQGKVWERIEANPRFALFDLSQQPAADAVRVLDITNNTDEPIGFSAPMINVTNYAAEIRTNRSGRDYQLVVRLISPPVFGESQGLITIHTSCKEQPILAVSAITINPAMASAPPATGGKVAPGDFQRIDDAQVTSLLHNEQHAPGRIVFIDARNDRDYQSGHIPGACQFDPYHPEKYQAALPLCRAAEQVVVYCHGVDCEDSDLAARSLREAGVASQKLFIYAGGMQGWSALQLPIEVSAQDKGQP